jgi:oxygen-dependent protoporphyrinogen oxidase
VVVVGGGLAGLAAAWDLRDLDVVVLESSERVGGRLKSEQRGDVWMNFGAHVFSGRESATGRLIEATGATAVDIPGRLAAAALGGRIVASGPVETYPFRLPMSPRSRLAMVRAGLKLRLAVRRYASIATPRPGEDASERQQRMLDFYDDRSFAEFLGPLPADVDSVFRATLTRSSGEPEELAAGYGIGYFHLVWSRSGGLSRGILGGPTMLVQGLAGALEGRIRTGAAATSVRREGDGVRIEYSEGGQTHSILARFAVVATPAYVAREIIDGLPDETAAALGQVRYGPYAVGAILTRRDGPMPWDGIYALATPGCSFSMLFNIANVAASTGSPVPTRGSFMVYAAADQARRLLELPDDQIAQRFTDDLVSLYPKARGTVEEVLVQRWERGLPFPRVGRGCLQPALMRSLGPILLAGDYLGSWYTETAAQTAAAAARRIREAHQGATAR